MGARSVAEGLLQSSSSVHVLSCGSHTDSASHPLTAAATVPHTHFISQLKDFVLAMPACTDQHCLNVSPSFPSLPLYITEK